MKIAMGPEGDQLKALFAGPAGVPVVMVNLLRFEARADEGERSGEAAYRDYATPMRKLVESRGGRFVWSGRAASQVIGESDVAFDYVALVEYPSRQVFAEIASSAEFQAIEAHRTAGLEGQWLIAAGEEGLET